MKAFHVPVCPGAFGSFVGAPDLLPERVAGAGCGSRCVVLDAARRFAASRLGSTTQTEELLHRRQDALTFTFDALGLCFDV